MKYLKKFEYTNQDFRNDMSDWSKEMHANNAKEFYLILSDKSVAKLEIPEEYRGEFEEEYTGGDYGSFYKDTAEYIHLIANDWEAIAVVMDYEIDDFIENLNYAKNNKPQEQ